MLCPCGNKESYASCCEPLLNRSKKAEHAEELMRSRYTAFCMKDIEYLKDTTHPSTLKDFDIEANTEWAQKARFTQLEILSASEKGDDGFVHFRARYRMGLTFHGHEEKSIFRRESGTWYFVEGEVV